ncbi:MAG: alpha-amylase family glycosyl hydrolase [Gemmatimonadota bacterium]|jgi:glycosidase
MKRSSLALLLSLGLVLATCTPADQPVPESEPGSEPEVESGAAGPTLADSRAFAAQTSLYEVFVRDFSTEGTFQGVIDGLDRIQDAGAEVVWLMPIHPVGELRRKGTLGSSYSGRDYRGINPNYGTAEDLHSLVEAVHARGMKIILDWVPNHTAWDHVWIEEHPEYYARNAEGEMTHPRDLAGNLTDWTDVAELDYGNPDLRRAMIDAMRYWLEDFDIDGYRVDVAGFIPPDFYREAIPELRSVKPILMLAEWDEPWLHEVGFDLTYPWASYGRLKEVWEGNMPAARFLQAEIEDLAQIPDGGLRMRMTTNHDETAWDEPPVTLFGGSDGARAAFVAMALLPGPPLLYNGQEVESPQVLELFEREAIQWDRPGADQARAFYRSVIDLSRTHPSLATGGALEVVATDAEEDVIAYRRGNVVVLVNARSEPVSAAVQGVELAGAGSLLGGGAPEGPTVDLPAYGWRVLELASGG